MTDENLKPIIQALEAVETGLYEQDVLLTSAIPHADLCAVLTLAEALEAMIRRRIDTRLLGPGLAVSIFRDQSTRTRYSFAAAAAATGLAVQDFDESKSQVAHGETARETANMISFLTDVIGIRDDLFIGEGHRGMRATADAVTEGAREGVLAHRPSIINLQCDLDHPTQTLADLLHLKQTFGSLYALRGRRVAMTWAYSPSYGKPLSVPQGIITLMTRFGMDVVLAHPPGYDLIPETVAQAERFAAESGGSFRRVESMRDAFDGAEVVYPKSWAPIDVMRERTRLLRAGERSKLETLESQCLERNRAFIDWECDGDMMARTRDGKALYMHCLPADISGVSCERGEVTADVFERARLATCREASHKPFIIAAMIYLTRLKNAGADLARLLA